MKILYIRLIISPMINVYELSNQFVFKLDRWMFNVRCPHHALYFTIIPAIIDNSHHMTYHLGVLTLTYRWWNQMKWVSVANAHCDWLLNSWSCLSWLCKTLPHAVSLNPFIFQVSESVNQRGSVLMLSTLQIRCSVRLKICVGWQLGVIDTGTCSGEMWSLGDKLGVNSCC